MILITYPLKRKTFDVFNILSSRDNDIEMILGYKKDEFSHVIHNLIYGQTKFFIYSSVKEIVEYFNLIQTEVVYVPIEEDLTLSFLEYQTKQSLGMIKFTLPDIDIYRLVRDKFKLSTYCIKNSISVPKVYTLTDPQQYNGNFPLLLKPKIGSGSRGIYRVHSSLELTRIAPNSEQNFLQEILPNSINVEAVNFFAIKGVITSAYGHRRLRTFPSKGGVSVESEYFLEKDTLQEAKNIIRSLKYSGLGMIEFLRDDDGKVRLIEINPRIWGSIILAAKAEPFLLKDYIKYSLDANTPINEVDGAIQTNYGKMLWILPYGMFYFLSLLSKSKVVLKDYVFINFSYSKWYRSAFFIFLVYPRSTWKRK